MAREKNDGRGRMGGRSKGTPNKKTQDLLQKVEDMGIDPFEVLLLFAGNRHEALGYDKYQDRVTKDGSVVQELTISPELRASCAYKACNFIYPKRKAVEHSQDPEKPLFETMSDEELKEHARQIAKELLEMNE